MSAPVADHQFLRILALVVGTNFAIYWAMENWKLVLAAFGFGLATYKLFWHLS